VRLARGCARRWLRDISRRGCAAAAAVLAAAACAGPVPRIPAPEGGAVAVDSGAALEFQKRADGFYLRLAHRRFNTLETFNDFVLRDHFQSPDLFFDYYADLAQALTDTYFDRADPSACDSRRSCSRMSGRPVSRCASKAGTAARCAPGPPS